MQEQSAIIKATVLGRQNDIPTSRKMPEDPFREMYGDQIIEPPYDMEALVQLPEYSNILPQCIEAMETNIDGFGFTLVPAEGVKPDKQGRYSPEVDAERRRVLNFFKYCHPEESFVSLRRKMRKDLETTGNGYWEIIRNGAGEICGIEHLESHTMRLTKLDPEPIEVKYLIKNEKNEYEETPYMKRFRRYVQIRDNRKVYFKEFGDPRRMNAMTGEYLKDDEDASGVLLATEVIHFKIYSPSTPYGVPRWIGTALSVMGSRQAEEVNYEYFDNKAVPPLVLLVSGKVAKTSKKKIEDYIEENLKGRKGFHKILIIEAETTPNPAAPAGQKVGLELKPLTEAQQKDQLFGDYDEKNQEKVRSSFRLPKFYVGQTKDFNRSTAEEAKRIAEEQVFGPERDEFDFIINRRLFPAMGIRFWEFKSLAATIDNALDMTKMLDVLAKSGLTVGECRRVMEEILNKQLPDPAGADWLDMPMAVYLAKLQAGLVGQPEGEEQSVQKFAKFLIEVRKALADAESGDTFTN